MKKVLVLLIYIIAVSCVIENIDPLAPIMITDEPISVAATTATLGGRVLGEGGLPVSEYGIVYSQTNPPTINDIKINEGEGLGSFSRQFSGFENETKYFCAAYGINNAGVGYGAVYEFITDANAPCNPETDNAIDNGIEAIEFNQINRIDPIGFNDGNIEFIASASNSTFRIRLQFKETDATLPLPGSYTTINEFNNQTPFSDGKVKLYAGTGFGILAATGESIFIEENTEGSLSFIFCNVPVGNDGITYTLNGKFTYIP